MNKINDANEVISLDNIRGQVDLSKICHRLGSYHADLVHEVVGPKLQRSMGI